MEHSSSAYEERARATIKHDQLHWDYDTNEAMVYATLAQAAAISELAKVVNELNNIETTKYIMARRQEGEQ